MSARKATNALERSEGIDHDQPDEQEPGHLVGDELARRGRSEKSVAVREAQPLRMMP